MPGQIYWLLEDAKRYGTLPFAGLARVGFIAVQMLRSLVKIGIFNENEYGMFLQGVSTINKKMSLDRYQLSKDDFLEQYGHLRPGTYDILSPRYDEAPDLYFSWGKKAPQHLIENKFEPSSKQLKELEGALKKHGLETDPLSLF